MMSNSRPGFYLTIAALCFAMGCGMDEDDIRKYAIRRPKDDDPPPVKQATGDVSTPPVAASPPANVGAVNATAVSSPGIRDAGAQSSESNIAVPSTPVSATGSDPVAGATSASSQSLSDTKAPDSSLSETDRRRISIDNMKRIAAAFQTYVAEKGVYPSGSVLSPTGTPLLSWRVELLPYLGYEQLYRAFHLDEPWTSPANQALLSAIPAVYQSPERCDELTNYVVPLGTVTAFNGTRSQVPSRWEDGRGGTVILLEVDNASAVPWTAPQDLSYSSQNPKANLFGLRSDGIFVGLDGGAVMRVPPEIDIRDLRAIFTVDGGESFQISTKCKLASAEVAGKSANAPSSQVAMASATLAGSGDTEPSYARTAPAYDEASSDSLAASATLAQKAERAHLQGLETTAIQLALASHVIAEPTTAVGFQWVPALKRPATALRFAVGIDYVGTKTDNVRKQFDNITPESPVAVGRFTGLVGDLAEPILSQVANQSPFVPPVCQTQTARPGHRDTNTSIYFTGIGNQATLLQACLRNHYDVLLMFRVEERKSRSGIDVKAVKFSVYDVWTNRSLMREQSINYLKRENESHSPLYEDPVRQISAQFAKLLETDCRPTEMPTALRPEHAARRAKDLSKMKQPSPLGPLAELKFYRDANLITAAQMMEAAEQLLTSGGAINLLAGNPTERLHAIDPWIPHPQLAPATPARGLGGSSFPKQDRDP